MEDAPQHHVEVRPEAPEDVGAVRDVHERAFAPSAEEADLVDALRGSAAHAPELCLVALVEDMIVGHIAFSEARVASGHPVLALAPLAVLPEHQRRGVGSALVSAALRRAAGTGFPLVVVLGHPAYYPRFGFERGARLHIVAPFPVPAQAWMVHRLPAYERGVRGRVTYPGAFAGATRP